MEIKVRQYLLCGENFYYPQCEYSEGLCLMKKKKSLSEGDIKFLKKYHKVEIT